MKRIDSPSCRDIVTHNGKTQTMREWAKEYNIPETTFMARYYAYNWDFERCINQKVNRQSRSNKHEAFGQSKSYEEWAEITGLPLSIIRNRKCHGWSMEEALTEPMRDHKVRTVKSHGAFGESKTLAEWARLSGIKRKTLYARVMRGMTMEEALTAKVSIRRKYAIRQKNSA